jgi:hypothetical protein
VGSRRSIMFCSTCSFCSASCAGVAKGLHPVAAAISLAVTRAARSACHRREPWGVLGPSSRCFADRSPKIFNSSSCVRRIGPAGGTGGCVPAGGRRSSPPPLPPLLPAPDEPSPAGAGVLLLLPEAACDEDELDGGIAISVPVVALEASAEKEPSCRQRCAHIQVDVCSQWALDGGCHL